MDNKEPYEITENGTIKITLNKLEELSLNYAFNRLKYIQSLIDPNKDIYGECGYPKVGSIGIKEYKEMYTRETGKRVVSLEPSESWKVSPTVYEVEDEDVETPFEQAWKELVANFGGVSWFSNDEGSQVISHLKRADEVSGIGRYGVLLIGYDDGKELDQPLPEIVQAVEKRVMPTQFPTRKLLYLQSYDEEQAQIESLEADPKNPRYGRPKYYNLSVNPEDLPTGTSSTIKVHWSRVIHIADGKTSSEVYGTPRQEAVFNRLIDLRKLYGGSGEMYYRGAFPGIALENIPGYTGTLDTTAAKEQLFDYTNSLQRWLAISGVRANQLSVQVASPKEQIECQIEAICIIKEIPLRIFKGSERGELASTTDKDSWEERVDSRRNLHVTPNILVPFINHLILTGCLPPPKEKLKVAWETEKELNPTAKAKYSKTIADALAVYTTSNARTIITPFNFFTKILKLSAKEAQSLIEDSLEEGLEPDDGTDNPEDNPNDNQEPNPSGNPTS